MSVGPLGGLNVSAAGAPLAQTKGSEVERASQDVGAQHRGVVYEQKAEAAAGIGEADGEEHQTDERDADGRQPWKRIVKNPDNPTAENAVEQPSQSRDTSGECGKLLDLTG